MESAKNAKGQEKVANEMKVIMEGINGAEVNREKLINIRESLDNDFVSGVKKAEFKKRRDSGSRYDFQSKHIEATK